jgi:hypothetical protein
MGRYFSKEELICELYGLKERCNLESSLKDSDFNDEA